jgi:Tol biopolymer transport system component
MSTMVAPHATSSGCAANDPQLQYPVFSPDGTQIVFESNSGDYGPVDTNSSTDIFLYDLAGGTTWMLSTDAAGSDSAAGSSSDPRFSPDATKISFTSSAGISAPGPQREP